MQHQVILLFFFVAGFVSCHDGADVICDDVRNALLTYDVTTLKEKLQPWLDALPPRNGYYDSSEHAENLYAFKDQLNDVCDLNAFILCYACIETFPAQSEIKVELDSAGQVVSRVVDIWTPDDTVMTIRSIHE